MSNDKLALYLSAEKHRLAKNISRAIKIYEQILEIEPDDLGILKKLTGLYVSENISDKAAALYKTIARIQMQKERIEFAFDAVRKALELTPDDKEAASLLEEIEESQKVDIEVEAGEDTPNIEEAEVPPIKLETPLFKDLNDEQLESIIKVITPLKIPKETNVFKEGDLSNSLYIISDGSFEVRTNISISQDTNTENVFSVLTPGHFFGEFAFLTGCPRVATVQASEDSIVYQLTKEDLDDIIKQFPEVEDRLFLFYKSRALDLVLAKSPLFKDISVDERREMLELFVLKKFNAGEYIIKEGQKDDSLYLIKKGELRVETSNLKGKKVFLSTLGQHQFFGEISYLTGLPRTADVIAATDCEILLIGKEDLQNIISTHPNIEKVLKQFQQHRALSTAQTLTKDH